MELTADNIRNMSKLDIQLLGEAEYFSAVWDAVKEDVPSPARSTQGQINAVMKATGFYSLDDKRLPFEFPGMPNYHQALVLDKIIKEMFDGMSPEDVKTYIKLCGG